ncbi:MAG TPA: 30S ribosome-binding factor RbfA [Ruminiclostridium sp.]|nr:30S ribosome-binding factor RbfA [Clostridiaceae bacterium]HAA24897.1 30S ribosome-binding factor RbfA [Ruminiclostridium sp.]
MERTDRIAGEIQKEISDIIRTGVKDPRLPDLVSVTGVRVTKDLRYAKVYISVFGDEQKRSDAINALNHAAGFIRRELGQRIKLRYTPELMFIPDDSIEQGIHIGKLIEQTMNPDKG